MSGPAGAGGQADPAVLAFDLHAAGRTDEAETLYRRALADAPMQPAILHNLALAMESNRRPPDRILAVYRIASAIDPSYGKAEAGAGGVAFGRGAVGTALRHWERAVRLVLDNASLWFNLGVAQQMAGDAAAAADSYAAALRLRPDDPAMWSQHLLCLNYLDLSGRELLERHRRFGDAFGTAAAAPPHANAADPERRLRIGYLSVEFRSHLGGYFLAPLLERHDRTAVEITCYSLLPPDREDEVTARFRTLADRWRTVDRLDNEALAARIRADGIDILVDLAGHSGLNRLPMLARRPAPVQATWLGYPNTTGLDCVDYRIVDPVSDPPASPGGTSGRGGAAGHAADAHAADAHASESLARLPGPFLCFRPPADAPAVVPLPAGARGAVTFGSFNKLAKLTDATVALWAEVLRRAPGTRLLLKDRPLSCPEVARSWRDRFARHGIDPDRLDLLGWIADPGGHLAAYNRIDIALDPHPYNGTITTCDLLWMGAPLVTLRGERHAARVGASLMTAIGLPGLVAATPDRYADIAAGLAGDLTGLMRLRMGMRERVAASPLCDEPRFLRHLETAYRLMWRHWCAAGRSALR
ncbi:tetratricopeptide repeat protein (plasmid) [Azospirillum sp. 412522]|nr:tetratricopeptide repeat protein [Azospirillum sp. 412522]MBY6266503.1 tetratricopeptide repeat protein [Azospirillum sp. 412522]